MLIDSHAHIQGKEYAGEAAAVIGRAREAGVETIIAVGGAGDMSSNTEAISKYLCDGRHASARCQGCR
jgi:TatD DNase family protein